MSPVTAPAVGSSSSPSGGLACAIAALAERQQSTGESSTHYSEPVSRLDMLPSSSRSSKRMKKTQRKHAECSSKQICSSSMISEGCEVSPALEVAEVGTSYINSDDSEGEGVILPPPPPPPMYRRWNSKRGKNIQRKYSFERASFKNLHDRRVVAEDWEFDHGSEVAEAGTTYASSDESNEDIQAAVLPPPPPPPPPLLPPYVVGSGSGCSDHGEYLLPPPYVTDSGFQSPIPGPIVPENFEEQMMLAMAVSLAEARARTTAQGVAWH